MRAIDRSRSRLLAHSTDPSNAQQSIDWVRVRVSSPSNLVTLFLCFAQSIDCCVFDGSMRRIFACTGVINRNESRSRNNRESVDGKMHILHPGWGLPENLHENTRISIYVVGACAVSCLWKTNRPTLTRETFVTAVGTSVKTFRTVKPLHSAYKYWILKAITVTLQLIVYESEFSGQMTFSGFTPIAVWLWKDFIYWNTTQLRRNPPHLVECCIYFSSFKDFYSRFCWQHWRRHLVIFCSATPGWNRSTERQAGPKTGWADALTRTREQRTQKYKLS